MTQPVPTVNVVGATGEVEAVPAARVQEYLDSGYEVDTPELQAKRAYSERMGYGDVALGVGENLASGASVGLYDVGAGLLGGEEYRRERALRDAAIGPLGDLSQGAGAVLGAVATGGTGAAARGAATAARGGSLLARAGAAAASLPGAAVRAVAAPARGAARLALATEARLGAALAKAGATGETIAGRAAVGALRLGTGGAVEGGLAAAGHALGDSALDGSLSAGDVRGVAERVWGDAKTGAMWGFAGGAALGATGGAVMGAAAKLRRKFGLETDDALRAYAVQEARENAVKSLKPGKRAARQIKHDADDIGQHLIDDGLYITRGRDELAVYERAQAVMADEGRALDRMLTQADEFAPIDTAAITRRLDDEVFKVKKGMSKSERRAMENIRNEVEELYLDAYQRTRGDATSALGHVDVRNARKSLAEQQAKYGALQDTASSKYAKDAVRVIEDEIEKSVSAVPGVGSAYKASKQRWRAANWASSAVEEVAASAKGNRQPSLTDTLAGIGGAGLGGHLGLSAGAATALATTYAHSYVRRKGRGIMVDALQAAIGASKSEALAIRAAVRGGTERAKRGTRDLIGETAAAITQHDRQKRANVVPADYQRDLSTVMAARSAPPDLAIQAAAPRVAMAMAETRQAAADYLARTAPTGLARGDGNAILARMHRDRPPDPVQLRKWYRRKEAIDNPKSVLDSVAEGRLTREQVESWEAVYPERLADLREATMLEVAEHSEDIPRDRRIQLGLLLGIPLDPALRPEQMAATQASYAATAKEMPQMARRSGTPKTSHGFSTLSSELETESDYG